MRFGWTGATRARARARGRAAAARARRGRRADEDGSPLSSNLKARVGALEWGCEAGEDGTKGHHSGRRAGLERVSKAHAPGGVGQGGAGGEQDQQGGRLLFTQGWGWCGKRCGTPGRRGGSTAGGFKGCKAAGLEPVTCPSRRRDHGSGSVDGEAGRASKSRTDLRQAGAMHVREVVRGARCAGWRQGWRGGARDAPGP